MAIAEYGAIITDLKGSMGGTTFQHNRSGKIVRNKPRPNPRQTFKQTIQHTVISALNIAWHALPLLKQDLWDVFALANPKIDKFGNSLTLSGFNWFFSINSNLTAFGNPTIGSPPVYVPPSVIPTVTTNLTAAIIQLDFVPNWNPTDSGIFIFATGPIKTRNNNFDRHLKKIFTGLEINDSKIVLTSEWDSAFGFAWADTYVSDGFNMGFLLIPINTVTGVSGTPIRIVGTPI